MDHCGFYHCVISNLQGSTATSSILVNLTDPAALARKNAREYHLETQDDHLPDECIVTIHANMGGVYAHPHVALGQLAIRSSIDSFQLWNWKEFVDVPLHLRIYRGIPFYTVYFGPGTAN